MDKKYQQVQCWQLDLYGHLNVGVHPAEGHQLDGDDLPRHDTETGEGHPLQEEEAPHPEDALDQGRGPLPRGGDTAGQARVHHVEDFFLCLSYISQITNSHHRESCKLSIRHLMYSVLGVL